MENVEITNRLILLDFVKLKFKAVIVISKISFLLHFQKYETKTISS